MAKRRADKQLTHENWEEEDEPEEVGIFEKAPEAILKNRVIKTAKRRGIGGSTTEEGGPKPLFSGFSGFSSANSNTDVNVRHFGFLSGNKTSDSTPPNSITGAKSFSFLSGNKTSDSTPPNSITGAKSFSFLTGNKTSDSTSTSDNQNASKFSFSASKNESETIKSSGDASFEPFSFLAKSKLPNGTNGDGTKFSPSFPSKATTSVPSSNKLSMFETEKSKPEPSSCNIPPKSHELLKKLKKNEDEPLNKSASSTAGNDGKNREENFLRKLRSLNLLCAEWILEHLNKDPHVILTPVFEDYGKHLSKLQEERLENAATSSKKAKIEPEVEAKATPPPSSPFKAPDFKESVSFKAPDFKESLSKVNFGASFFNKPPPQQKFEQLFGNSEIKSTFEFSKSTKSESENVAKPVSNPLFSFGSSSSSSDTQADPSTESDKPKPISDFSFSAGSSTNQFKNPFFAATSIPAPSEATKAADNNEDNDDQPPVLEDVSITEEGSVFDIKCKVFIKKDSNYVDHGVGFLFLKLVGEEKKCQLIVRANNKLANVIINVLISGSLPLQKQGKNNVMIVCYPTPDAKQPSAVLLKVKTTEDADQLLELMNKYKK